MHILHMQTTYGIIMSLSSPAYKYIFSKLGPHYYQAFINRKGPFLNAQMYA